MRQLCVQRLVSAGIQFGDGECTVEVLFIVYPVERYRFCGDCFVFPGDQGCVSLSLCEWFELWRLMPLLLVIVGKTLEEMAEIFGDKVDAHAVLEKAQVTADEKEKEEFDHV